MDLQLPGWIASLTWPVKLFVLVCVVLGVALIITGPTGPTISEDYHLLLSYQEKLKQAEAAAAERRLLYQLTEWQTRVEESRLAGERWRADAERQRADVGFYTNTTSRNSWRDALGVSTDRAIHLASPNKLSTNQINARMDSGIQFLSDLGYQFDDEGSTRLSASLLPGERQRAQAIAAAKRRDHALNQSRRAWSAGYKAEAKSLSVIRKRCVDETTAHNAEAASLIFAHHNPRYSTSSPSTLKTCDLHRLFVSEAMQCATEHIHACRRMSVRRTRFITGRGRGSHDGESKLTPAVKRLAREMVGVTVMENDRESGVGSVVVIIDSIDVDDFV